MQRPLLWLLCAFFAGPAAAAERILMVEGHSVRARVPFEIRPSAVSTDAPEVVRVTPGSRRGEVVVFGRRPGRASLAVADESGAEAIDFEIEVLRRDLRGERGVVEGIPESVRVSVQGSHVVLEGTVHTEAELESVHALAEEAPNVLVGVKLASEREGPPARASVGSRADFGPRAPELALAATGWRHFERYAVTLLPGTFVLAGHPFLVAGSKLSNHEIVEATTESCCTLFVGKAPGTGLLVAHDAANRRWVVYDVTVLSPSHEGVQRTAPTLPPGVRIELRDGKILLSGDVTREEDAGAAEVIEAMLPGMVTNSVRLTTALPPPYEGGTDP